MLRPRRLTLSSALLVTAFGAAAQPNPSWGPTVDSGARLRELFTRPPAAFSTAPFFVWNGDVNEAEIGQYLAQYHSLGIDSFIIHPRPGLITPYLSERWFSLVRHTVDKAKQLGMNVWLYDEDSYPSGFAGGHVPADMPESYNEGQGLTLRKLAQLDPAIAANCKFLLKREGEAFRDITSPWGAEMNRPGEYYCFDLTSYPKRDWNAGFSYVDLIRPGVTQKFIEVTMGGYEGALNADLGRTVLGVFSDEPNINPPSGRNSMRWTPDLFAEFQKRAGYDLKVRLPELYEETGDWRKARHDYYSVLLDLFIERWSKPYSQYAEKTGIAWTGHYWEHTWPNPAEGPDNMAMYAWPQVPGIDILFNNYSEDVNAQVGNVRSVRELASVANQMGKRRTLSETYGGGGWDLRFEDMKRIGDWEYALGINLMNQHLSYETIAGERKHDYPQSFSYHEPWWDQYGVLANYFARLSLALSSGEQVNRVLVIEPTTSAWMYGSPGQANPRMMEIGRAFQDLLNRLEALQVEYDIGSENIMRDHGKAAGGKLTVGRRSYDVVVLPPGTENIEPETARLIDEFLSGGGSVLSFVDPPAFVQGARSDRLTSLAQQQAAHWIPVRSPADAAFLERVSTSDFRISWDPQSGGKLLHHRRQLLDGQVIFLANANLEQKAAGILRVNARSVRRLDPLTGATVPEPVRTDGAAVEVAFDIPPAGSLLLLAGDQGQPARAPGGTPEWRAVAPIQPLRVERMAPNALPLEYCDLTLGGAVQKEQYVLTAERNVFQFFGFAAGDPWATAVQYRTAILDKNKFPPGSGFEATFHFELGDKVDSSTLRAVVERPELWQASVNGKVVKALPNQWWLDRAFGVYDIGADATKGRNAITLKASPMSVHNELQPIYIIGPFNLEPADTGWRLAPPSALKTGPWKDQALPFYAWAVSYAASYRLERGQGRVKVRLGKWGGSVAEVKVNGKSGGIIGWQPCESDISGLVRSGENRIEVVVRGTLRNLLGPHFGNGSRGSVNPGSWSAAPAAPPSAATYDLDAYGLMEDFQVLQSAR
ncbi:MAG: glycosyl hydrolase [Bryobacteraceae bacterium]